MPRTHQGRDRAARSDQRPQPRRASPPPISRAMVTPSPHPGQSGRAEHVARHASQWPIPDSHARKSPVPRTAEALGYDAVVQGPNARSRVDQGIANVDYLISDKDRLSAKYYYQNDPTTNPFGYDGSLLGFAQQFRRAARSGPSATTSSCLPTVTWEQHVGFTRMRAYAATGSGL